MLFEYSFFCDQNYTRGFNDLHVLCQKYTRCFFCNSEGHACNRYVCLFICAGASSVNSFPCCSVCGHSCSFVGEQVWGLGV